MTKVLITGASGFIGSNLTRRLLQSRDDIIIFVRKNSDLWRLKEILKHLEVLVVNMNDLESISKIVHKINPELVFHLSAYGVYPFQKDLNSFIESNITGSVNLMQSLEACGSVKKFVNIGTSAEYKSKLTPMKETDMTEPTTPYSITKLAQTHFVQYFAKQHKLPTVTLRLFSPYGPYEQLGRLISDIMISIVRKTRLKLFSPFSVRDFIYIDDVVTSILKATESNSIDGEIFNIGSGKFYSVKDVIEAASEIANTELEISWRSEEKKHSFDSGKIWQADIEKANHLLKWTPVTPLREGLSKTLTWFKNNIHLYENY